MKKSKKTGKPKAKPQLSGVEENEFFIRMSPKTNERNNQKRKTTVKKKKSISKVTPDNMKRKVNKKSSTKNFVNKKWKKKVLRWIFITILIALGTTIFLMSAVFNIREITVYGNNRLSSQEIIEKTRIGSSEIICLEEVCGVQNRQWKWSHI